MKQWPPACPPGYSLLELGKLSAKSELNGKLKEQSNESFDLQFFSSFEPAWATDQWVNIFSILVKILQSYSNFSVEKTDFLHRAYVAHFWNCRIRIHIYFLTLNL